MYYGVYFKFKGQVAKSQKVEPKRNQPSRLQTKLSERHKQLAEVADAPLQVASIIYFKKCGDMTIMRCGIDESVGMRVWRYIIRR